MVVKKDTVLRFICNEINQAHITEEGWTSDGQEPQHIRDARAKIAEYDPYLAEIKYPKPQAFYKPDNLSTEDMKAFEAEFKVIDEDKSGVIDKKEWYKFICRVSGLGEDPRVKAEQEPEMKRLMFELNIENAQEKKEREAKEKQKAEERERQRVTDELIAEAKEKHQKALARRHRIKAERNDKVRELMANYKK